MAKNVVIVESPAKAKTIERYLGGDFRVEASMGHVRDLPPTKLGVDIEHDFQPEYAVLRGKQKTVTALKKAVARAAAVYMATDLDREGEAIAWHLCEALGLDPREVHRVVFNEITKSAITEAFAQPGHIDMNKVAAQEARRILDRLVGYKLSPLLWKKVANGLSAGRVQSVAVRLVVDREREIRNFTPEEYWTIAAHLSRRAAPGAEPGEEQEFKAALAEVNAKNFRPSTGADARAVGDRLRQARYRVASVGTRQVQDKAPPPFITSELQRAASTQLGFSAKKTMTLAQQLYQGVELGPEGSVALITYMRTDSYHVAPAALEAVRALIDGRFGPEYVPEKPMFFKSRGRAQEAHEAIRPTDVARTPDRVKPHLESDAARLYELIWKRFVASQMNPAILDVTEVQVEAIAPETRGLFKARGRVVVFDGHMKVSGIRLSEDEQQLPALAQGQPLDLKKLEEAQHFTQPPSRYTEATLVKQLESLGIGRPSTYASIISTIQDRGYVMQEKNLFLRCANQPKCSWTVPCDLKGRPMWPMAADMACRCGAALTLQQGQQCLFATDLGEVVTDKLVRHFPDIMDTKFTSHMEDELDQVEESAANSLSVIREFWEPFSADLARAADEMESTKHQPVEEAGPCPTCGAPLVKRWSKHGPFLGCSKYPDCKYTRPLGGNGVDTTNQQAAENAGKCPECGGALVQRFSKRGPFIGCSKYPDCKYTQSLEGQPRPEPKHTEHKCDKCGGTMLLRYNRRGEPFLGCENYPKCRSTLPCDAQGNPQRPEPTGEVCDKCGAPMVIKNSRRGPFLACSAFPKCRNAKSLPKAKKGAGEAGAGRKGKPPAGRGEPAAGAAGGSADASASGPGASGSGPRAAPRRASRPKPVMTDRDCPDCGAKLVIRTGRRGPFLGCSKYPKCRHAEDVPPDLAS